MPTTCETEYSPEELHGFHERTVRRGLELRRRRQVIVSGTLALVLIAAAIPIAVLSRSETNPSPTLAVVGAGQYADVAWHSVEYPGLNFATIQYPRVLGCGTSSARTQTGYVFSVEVQQVSYVQPHGGPRLAMVLVRCRAGSPTPSSLYAFDGVLANGKPQLFQVLLPPMASQTFWYATEFSFSGDQIVMSARGADANTPICCPDVSAVMHWRWDGARLVGPTSVSRPMSQGNTDSGGSGD